MRGWSETKGSSSSLREKSPLRDRSNKSKMTKYASRSDSDSDGENIQVVVRTTRKRMESEMDVDMDAGSRSESSNRAGISEPMCVDSGKRERVVPVDHSAFIAAPTSGYVATDYVALRIGAERALLRKINGASVVYDANRPMAEYAVRCVGMQMRGIHYTKALLCAFSVEARDMFANETDFPKSVAEQLAEKAIADLNSFAPDTLAQLVEHTGRSTLRDTRVAFRDSLGVDQIRHMEEMASGRAPFSLRIVADMRYVPHMLLPNSVFDEQKIFRVPAKWYAYHSNTRVLQTHLGKMWNSLTDDQKAYAEKEYAGLMTKTARSR